MAEKKLILVVDDDPAARQYLTAVLEDNNYDYITAVDGEEGLKKARESHPAAILLDLMMPKKSGVKFLNEIKQDESLRSTPIIVQSGASKLTGVDMKKFLESQPYRDKKAKALGIDINTAPDGYLEKPVDPEKLIELLKNLA